MVDVLRTVSNLKQAIANISGFGDEVRNSTELQDRLPYIRSWYFVKDEAGNWQAAGSKYAGYRNSSAHHYVANSEAMDGRRSERALNQWFVPVPSDDPLHGDLMEWLHDALNVYRKKPSALARVNVTKLFWNEQISGGASKEDEELAELVIAIVRRLSPALKKRIKNRC